MSNTANNNPRSKGARFFDWFVLAGLLMNVLVVLALVGIWLFH